MGINKVGARLEEQSIARAEHNVTHPAGKAGPTSVNRNHRGVIKRTKVGIDNALAEAKANICIECFNIITFLLEAMMASILA